MLHRVKEERNILHAIKRRNAKCVKSLCTNCLKNTLLREREKRDKVRKRRKQLLDDLRYMKLMETEKALPGRLHCMENLLWKRLGTCRTRENRANDIHLDLLD